jgi:imidazolonepropionase-like amidohydrolase
MSHDARSCRAVRVGLFLSARQVFLLSVLGATLVCRLCAGSEHVELNTPSDVSGDQVVAVVGARLIDGNGGPPLDRATLIIRGSKIESVGPSDSVPVPNGATRVDLSGMTIVPGFVDCHFHSINDLNPPQRFLANGVTAFRDPGHPIRFYQAVRQTSKPMPRLFLTGSHLDAYPPIWPQQARIVGNALQAKEAVEENVRGGATAIKIYFRLPLDLIRVACDTAHRHSVPVTAHLELVKASDAIDAGLDGIEHVTSFGTSLAAEAAVTRFVSIVDATPSAREEWRYRLWAGIRFDDSTRLDKVLKQIVDNDVSVSPTLAVFERRSDFDDVEDYEVAGFRTMLEFIGHCHRAGATIVAGSHTWVPGAKFGFAFQRELELLVESGLTPLEAITAGTRNGARFLQSDHRIGTIEPGKLADLVAVEGNPAVDISHLRSVRRVMLHGRWIEPE